MPVSIRTKLSRLSDKYLPMSEKNKKLPMGPPKAGTSKLTETEFSGRRTYAKTIAAPVHAPVTSMGARNLVLAEKKMRKTKGSGEKYPLTGFTHEDISKAVGKNLQELQLRNAFKRPRAK